MTLQTAPLRHAASPAGSVEASPHLGGGHGGGRECGGFGPRPLLPPPPGGGPHPPPGGPPPPSGGPPPPPAVPTPKECGARVKGKRVSPLFPRQGVSPPLSLAATGSPPRSFTASPSPEEVTGIGESPAHAKPLGGVVCTTDSSIPETYPPSPFHPSQPNTHSTKTQHPHQHPNPKHTQLNISLTSTSHPTTHPTHHPPHITITTTSHPVPRTYKRGADEDTSSFCCPLSRNSEASRSAGNTPALLGVRGRRTLSPVEARPKTLPWPVLQGREWKGEERLPQGQVCWVSHVPIM